VLPDEEIGMTWIILLGLRLKKLDSLSVAKDVIKI
jgi:hypothetical protein